MKITFNRVLVVGSARSGLAAAKLACQKGYEVTVYDGKKKQELTTGVLLKINQLEEMGILFCLGEPLEVQTYDFLIVSPGIPLEIPLIQEAISLGKKVIGEFEFATQFCKAPILAITGTNGKTTTTTLVGEIIKQAGYKTYVVGNIGTAFSEVVLDSKEDEVVVAEVSSFQLESIQSFRPHVSALLNITPDHLNRHKTMEKYCFFKYRITQNQTEEDYMILNELDTYYENACNMTKAKKITFNIESKVKRGAYIFGDAIWENIEGVDEPVCQVQDIQILGKHNLENVLAAVAVTRAFGICREVVALAVQNFKGVQHRIEYVLTRQGVDYYNDSKATNTDAAMKALLSMRKPIRLIAGGMDKKCCFKEWIKLFDTRVEKVYALGETRAQIKQECMELGFLEVELFNSFQAAVEAAVLEAKEGECVLLSPACASWDMFESYEQRGEVFKKIVSEMEG